MTLSSRIHADDCRHPHDPEHQGLREGLREQIESELTPRQLSMIRIALSVKTRAEALDALTTAEIERQDEI